MEIVEFINLNGRKVTFRLQQRYLNRAHIERLERGLPESLETTSIHMDIVENLYCINAIICRIVNPLRKVPVL